MHAVVIMPDGMSAVLAIERGTDDVVAIGKRLAGSIREHGLIADGAWDVR